MAFQVYLILGLMFGAVECYRFNAGKATKAEIIRERLGKNHPIIAPNAAGTHKGQYFIAAFMYHMDKTGANQLIITSASNVPATVTITMPYYDNYTTFAIAPDEIVRFTIAAEYRLSGSIASRIIEDKVAIIDSNYPISVYGFNAALDTSDGFVVLPAQPGDTSQFIVPSWPSGQHDTVMAVAATEDNTLVNFYRRLSSGYTFYDSIVLNLTEAYQLRSSMDNDDYTGMYINSSGPISVFSGHSCAFVPADNRTRCGHLAAQVPPLESWGTDFIVPPISGRQGVLTGYVVRVIASLFNMIVTFPGFDDNPHPVEAGMFYELDDNIHSDYPIRVSCNAPCLVVQYNKNNAIDNTGSNPFMMVIPPVSHYTSDYNFGIPLRNLGKTFRSFVGIVAPNTTTSSFTLNGVSLSDQVWLPVEGTTFSVASVFVGNEQVLHQLKNSDTTVKYGAFLYGHGEESFNNQTEGYGYPLGYSLGNGTFHNED